MKNLILHWTDGKETEYYVHAYEVNWLERTLKVWGEQILVFGHEAVTIPLVYADRPYALFDLNMIARMEMPEWSL